MLKIHPLERVKEIFFTNKDKTKTRYAITNYGRLISFTDDIKKDGRELKGSRVKDYRVYTYKYREDGKILYQRYFFHKLVAENFLAKESNKQTYVLHLDYNIANNYVANLKWATREEMLAHWRKNPKVLKVLEENHETVRNGSKLTITQVMHLKKRLTDPNCNTRMKTLAKQFGISEMQLYRIKKGKSWSRVKIDEI